MKYFLISDNIDTLTGMKLVGVNGVVAHEPEEVRQSIERVLSDESIAILLITEGLIPKCSELIYEIKLKYRRPLIVEIPDRHGSRSKDSIIRYLREAIGIKV